MSIREILKDVYISAAAVGLSIALSQNASATDDIRRLPYMGRLSEGYSATLPTRLALIIGVNSYNSSSKLTIKNLKLAAKDASDIQAALKKAGFSYSKLLVTSESRPNISRNDVLSSLSELDAVATRIAESTGRRPVILLYFAGHGISYDGQDYLLPSDFRPTYSEDIPEMALSVDMILKRLSWTNAALTVVVMDACRSVAPQTIFSRFSTNSPLLLEPGSQGKLQPVIDQEGKRGDRILLYSTLEGSVAYEDGEINGRFTGALLKAFGRAFEKAEAGSSAESGVDNMFDLVKTEMDLMPDSKQKPKMIKEAVNFKVFPTSADFSLEEAAWRGTLRISGSDSILKSSPENSQDDPLDTYQRIRFCNVSSFLAEYSNYSYFADIARQKIAGFLERNFKCSGRILKITNIRGSVPLVSKFDEKEASGMPSTHSIAGREAFPTFESIAGISEMERNSALGVYGIEKIRLSRKSTEVFRLPSKKSRVLSGIKAFDAIAVLGSIEGGMVKVIGPSGDVGFVSSDIVSSGRFAVRARMPFDVPETAPSEFEALARLSAQTFFTNAVVEYSSQDGQLGLRAAQEAADKLSILYRQQLQRLNNAPSRLNNDIKLPIDVNKTSDQNAPGDESINILPVLIRRVDTNYGIQFINQPRGEVVASVMMFAASPQIRPIVQFAEGDAIDPALARPILEVTRINNKDLGPVLVSGGPVTSNVSGSVAMAAKAESMRNLARKIADAKTAETAVRGAAEVASKAPVRVAAVEAPNTTAASASSIVDLSFRWPAKGRVISGYGSSGNEGINISVPEGTPVKAAEDGTVAYAGSDVKGFGRLVLVRHLNGYVTAYAHNRELDVRPGEKVKRGQTIAKSGASGNVTSPQLHFEIRKGANPVDPMPYLASN